jgi:hypothetical protein
LAYLFADGSNLIVGIRDNLNGIVYFALDRLLAFGPDHEAVLARKHWTSGDSENFAKPLVNCASCKLTDLVVDSNESVASNHARARM